MPHVHAQRPGLSGTTATGAIPIPVVLYQALRYALISLHSTQPAQQPRALLALCDRPGGLVSTIPWPRATSRRVAEGRFTPGSHERVPNRKEDESSLGKRERHVGAERGGPSCTRGEWKGGSAAARRAVACRTVEGPKSKADEEERKVDSSLMIVPHARTHACAVSSLPTRGRRHASGLCRR